MLKVDSGIITSFEEKHINTPPELSSCDYEMSSKEINSSLSNATQESLPNSDNDGDGLPDWWEKENAEVFAGLFGSDPLKVGAKDLIVEVDYIEGFPPCTKYEEIIALVLAVILTVLDVITIVSAVALITAAGSDIISVLMKGVLISWALAITVFTVGWWFNKPYESFYRITKYFSKKEGHSIHILYDPKDSKITLEELNSIEGLEDFNGWKASDDELRLIESIFHNDYRQRLNDTNLGVYILYIGNHKDRPIAPGKADTAPGGAESFGAVICTHRRGGYEWGNPWGHEYWTFAHELGYLLHLGHNNQEPTNFMNEVANWFYFPFPHLLHYDNSEWNDMDYIGRISAG